MELQTEVELVVCAEYEELEDEVVITEQIVEADEELEARVELVWIGSDKD